MCIRDSLRTDQSGTWARSSGCQALSEMGSPRWGCPRDVTLRTRSGLASAHENSSHLIQSLRRDRPRGGVARLALGIENGCRHVGIGFRLLALGLPGVQTAEDDESAGHLVAQALLPGLHPPHALDLAVDQEH